MWSLVKSARASIALSAILITIAVVSGGGETSAATRVATSIPVKVYASTPQAWDFRISVEHPSYAMGSDPGLMLTIVNRSSSAQYLPNLPLWLLTDFEVLDSHGRRLQPIPYGHLSDVSGGSHRRFDPNQSVGKEFGAQSFRPLSYSGYKLSRADDYTVVARLKLADFKTTVSSNQVHIRIHE